MSLETKMLPAILPKVAIVKRAPRGVALTISSLCQLAGIPCRVTGLSTEREVFLRESDSIEIFREPGPMGAVALGLPPGTDKETAGLALGILAHAVFDYVARESMRGRPEAQSVRPLGRPRKAHPLTGAERQRRWRQRLGSVEKPGK